MPPLPANDYEALANFRYLLRKFLRFSKDFLTTTAGINPEQYEALLAIKAFHSHEGLTISHLSERLQVKHHSAVNLVDRLAGKKLITRAASATDRRQRHIKLTEKGERLLEELATVHRKELRQRIPELIAALERLRR